MNLTDEMEGRFLRFLVEHLGSLGSDGLLVGVSGGLDSTALLTLALATTDRHGHPVVAGHVNHGIRPDADAEEGRLRSMCEGLGVPFRSERIRFADPHPSEDAMRRRRLRALRLMARAGGCGHVLLGHQRDDQAETVLLNLMRGAGLRGLSGIPPVRGPFVHPLLEVPRSDLRRYLEERRIPWVEDPTNLDMDRARNRVRRNLLPLIEEDVRPGATAAIARAAGHLRSACEALEGHAREALDACRIPSPPGEIRIDGDRLRSYPIGLIEFVVRLAVLSVSGTTQNVSTPAWRQIIAAARDGRSGRFLIQDRTIVDVTGRTVCVGPARANEPRQGEIPVPWSGRIAWGRQGILRTRLLSVREVPSRLRLRGLSRMQAFDAASVSPPVRIRFPFAGDRISLEESSGRRKISDLLSERGVPRSLRGMQPVIEDARGILWVPGIRRAGVARVGPKTETIWIARWFGPLPVDRALSGGAPRG